MGKLKQIALLLDIALGLMHELDDELRDTEKLKTAWDMTEGALGIVLEVEQTQ